MRKSPAPFLNGDEKKLKTTIHIIIGSMKSEKTLEAIRRAKRYQVLDGEESVIFINPNIDIRSSNGVATSRGGNHMECSKCAYLQELENTSAFQKADLVVIDEAQFFTDLYQHVMKHCDIKSYIVVSLDADWKQEKFGQVWDLIPYASLEKTQGFCEICRDGTPSVCTISTKELDGQVSVDSAQGTTYLAACLQHRMSEKAKEEFFKKQVAKPT